MEELKLSIKNKAIEVDRIVDALLEKAIKKEDKVDFLAMKMGLAQILKELENETNIAVLKFVHEWITETKKDMEELLDTFK